MSGVKSYISTGPHEKMKPSDDEQLTPPLPDRSQSSDLLIGLTLDGKYRLERRIGRGGMGNVYIGRHTTINRQVAVKVLSQDLMDDPTSIERFKREAEASARINHPNIVQVTDFNRTEEGIVYLVMEYVEGVTLRRLLDREQRLNPERAVELGRQICAAIAAAHRADVIHRDLKPDNVMIEMVDGRERARVLDFGIAKLKDVSQQGRITAPGNVLGTPHYMSPEQCMGHTVDHRSDIYALGVMLYEMLSGTVPFDAQTAPAIIVQHATKEPTPLTEACASVPRPLASLIMRALSKGPEGRPQTASEFGDALEAAIELSTIPHEMPPDPAIHADEWRILFLGLLEDTPANRRRVIDGLKQVFGFSPVHAEELINQQRAVLTKTFTKAEATKIAEKLRARGAVIKTEPVVTEPATVPAAPTVAESSRSFNKNAVTLKAEHYGEEAAVTPDLALLPRVEDTIKVTDPLPRPATAPGAAHTTTPAREPERARRSPVKRIAVLAVAALVIYIGVTFMLQNSQRHTLKQNIDQALATSSVRALRPSVRAAIHQSGLSVPADVSENNIKILVNAPERRVWVQVDYRRSVLGVSLFYQVKCERANFKLPLAELAALPDYELEVDSNTKEEVERFRRERRDKAVAKGLAGYQGEPETLKAREALQMELSELERALQQLDTRPAVKTVRIGARDYSQEAIEARIGEVRQRLLAVTRQLQEERARKEQEIRSRFTNQ